MDALSVNICNSNEQRLNTNTKIYYSNERSNRNVKIPNNATFYMSYSTIELEVTKIILIIGQIHSLLCSKN